jgi:hypothetical protein
MTGKGNSHPGNANLRIGTQACFFFSAWLGFLFLIRYNKENADKA